MKEFSAVECLVSLLYIVTPCRHTRDTFPLWALKYIFYKVLIHFFLRSSDFKQLVTTTEMAIEIAIELMAEMKCVTTHL